MANRSETDILVIGAGSVGIAVAYYLKKLDPEVALSFEPEFSSRILDYRAISREMTIR